MDDFPADYECEGQMSIWDYMEGDMRDIDAENEFWQSRKNNCLLASYKIEAIIDGLFPDGITARELDDIFERSRDAFQYRLIIPRKPGEEK